MNPKLGPKEKGVTLIELLVAMVITGIVIAGVYRLFIAQTRAYTIQDQVVDVQQTTRSAMELMLRDIRMAGYTANINPVALTQNKTIFPGDYVFATKDDAVRIEYQRNVDCNGIPGVSHKHTVVYYRKANGELWRDLYVDDGCKTSEQVLEKVNTLKFEYGVDGIVDIETTQDGGMDDRNGNGIIDDPDWVTAATVTGGNLNIAAIRITLTAAPSNPTGNPDISKIVDREMVSTVNLRNLCRIKE
ncbi:MAG TPA: prepilin-type N-terminal cleavage/methylation domain-containing protein [Thermodesulfobacteriota bacterium]|nr:prepilin-type N-terminal cleavage/methylation domain-containing protein [Thermodesulfobacteriota bacterium]